MLLLRCRGDCHYVCLLGYDKKPPPPGDDRTYRVFLDTNQYQIDMDKTVQGSEVSTSLTLYQVSVYVSSSKDSLFNSVFLVFGGKN